MPALNFDASQVAPWTQGAFNFPLGDYPFAITGAETKQVKNKPNSGLLELVLTVTDGPYRGMTHKTNFNLYNENETSRRIAHQQLSSVCHVIGRLHIQDTQQLIGGRGIVTLGPQDGSDKYCEVKMWKDMQSRVNGSGEPVPPPSAQPAAPAADASPWAGGAPAAAPAAQFPPAAAYVPQPAAPAAPAAAPSPWAQPAAPPAPAPAAPAQPWAQPAAPAPQAPSAPAAQPWANPQPTAPAANYAAQPAAVNVTTQPATAYAAGVTQPNTAAAPAPPWAQPQQ